MHRSRNRCTMQHQINNQQLVLRPNMMQQRPTSCLSESCKAPSERPPTHNQARTDRPSDRTIERPSDRAIDRVIDSFNDQNLSPSTHILPIFSCDRPVQRASERSDKLSHTGRLSLMGWWGITKRIEYIYIYVCIWIYIYVYTYIYRCVDV